MSLIYDLDLIVSSIGDFIDDMVKFAIPELTQDAIDQMLDGTDVKTNVASIISTSASTEYTILDKAVKEIIRSINSFKLKIDSLGLIPLDGYQRLWDTLDLDNNLVKSIVVNMKGRRDRNLITIYHFREFGQLMNGYREIFKELNECIVKYNTRHPMDKLALLPPSA